MNQNKILWINKLLFLFKRWWKIFNCKKLNTVPDRKILLIIKGLNLHLNRVWEEKVENKNDGNVSIKDN